MIAAVVAGCSPSATEAILTIGTEGLNAPTDYDRIDVVVKGVSGEVSRAQVRPCLGAETPAPGGCVRLPFTVLLIPGSERPRDSAIIEVTARLAGNAVSRSEISLMFTEGSTVRMTVLLRRGVLDGGVVDQATPDDVGPVADLLGLDLLGADLSTPDMSAIVRRVFLSDIHPGAFGGRPGASNFCQTDAVKAGLIGNFAAILADHSNSPSNTIMLNVFDRKIVRLDGVEVARDQNFWSNGHLVDMNIRWDGLTITDQDVWTGFTKDGDTKGFTSADPFCNDWFHLMGDKMGYVGRSSGGRMNGTWADSGSAACNNLLSFYCIEQ
jgi:hypothetical protein